MAKTRSDQRSLRGHKMTDRQGQTDRLANNVEFFFNCITINTFSMISTLHLLPRWRKL